jgi:septal ring factor EnvC (AmiA/AmiB activator)
MKYKTLTKEEIFALKALSLVKKHPSYKLLITNGEDDVGKLSRVKCHIVVEELVDYEALYLHEKMKAEQEKAKAEQEKAKAEAKIKELLEEIEKLNVALELREETDVMSTSSE